MTLHLRLWKDGDLSNATDRPFEQGVIGIGRDPSNTIQLETPNVSKTHARIEQRSDGLILIDLKSRNGTFVNGVGITPEEAHRIRPGDRVRVCDFIMEVIAWDQPATPESTAAAEKPGPESEITQGSAQRWAAAEQECRRLKAELAELQERLSAGRSEAQHLPQIDGSKGMSRLKDLLATVLHPFLGIMRGRMLFRSEFTGVTIVQNPEVESMCKQSPEELIRFFLDASLSDETAQNRLDLVSMEADEVISHVIGLLDGYRKCVDAGAKNMLRELSPARVRGELFKKPLRLGRLSIPYRFLPLVADRIAWKAIERQHRELEEEDRGNLEQRFFRTAFVQGYINCVSSAKHDSMPSRPKDSVTMKAQP